jgi:oxygen-dependent protoporphyrinogen oxidase
MEQKYGSLVRGALAARKHKRMEASLKNSSPGFPPLFTTLKDGLGRLVEELGKRLTGSRVFLKQRAVALDRASGMDAYTIRCEAGGEHKADAIIFALPGHECGRLLSSLDPALAESLQAIPYAPALTAALGYDASAGRRLPPGFGFLVPRQEKRRLLACTFVHNKFPHRAPPGGVLLRCFLGGSRDTEVMTLDDGEIVTVVRRELEAILGVTAAPLFYRIYRWPASMPQYAVGHADLVDRIEAQLQNHPGLFLAGNAYSGIGLSDCVRTGQAAAEAALKPRPGSLKS